MTEKQVSVIIPTFNESENICNVLKSIKEFLPKIDIEAIVVDDNSPDGTGKIVEDYIKSMILLSEILIKQGELESGEKILNKLLKNNRSYEVLAEINYFLGEIYYIKWSFQLLG